MFLGFTVTSLIINSDYFFIRATNGFYFQEELRLVNATKLIGGYIKELTGGHFCRVESHSLPFSSL